MRGTLDAGALGVHNQLGFEHFDGGSGLNPAPGAQLSSATMLECHTVEKAVSLRLFAWRQSCRSLLSFTGLQFCSRSHLSWRPVCCLLRSLPVPSRAERSI